MINNIVRIYVKRQYTETLETLGTLETPIRQDMLALYIGPISTSAKYFC